MSKLNIVKQVIRDLVLGTLAAAFLFTVLCYPFFNRHCFWCGGITLKPINQGLAYDAAKESVLDKIVNNYINPQGYAIHFECLTEWSNSNGS